MLLKVLKYVIPKALCDPCTASACQPVSHLATHRLLDHIQMTPQSLSADDIPLLRKAAME